MRPSSHTATKVSIMSRNTFSVQFYNRTSKTNKNGLAPIEMSIICNGERLLINLPYKCKPEDFNRKRRPKEIEDYLNAQRSLINKVITELAENGLPLTSKNVRDYYRTGGVKSYTANDLFEDYLNTLKPRVGHNLTKQVYRKYELVRDLFFEEFDKEQEATAITNYEVKKFFSRVDSKYDSSTACGYKTKFKAIVVFGIDNNKIKINPFNGIKITKKKKEIEYLTEEEVSLLMNTPITNESLAKVRDCAVFQIASGLSFADVAVLENGDLQEEDGVYFISKNRVKTNTPYFSVVLKEGVDVYKKYNGHIPLISNQKYNAYLKSIQTLCGIKTNLHSHLFRHTYCTRLLNKGVPIKTVSKCAGHQNSRITEAYYAHLENKTILSQVSVAMA